MTSIIVTHENNEMDEYDFDVEIKNITIGRRSTNDVCVPHLSVSGVHCKITIDDKGSMIEDQNSTNGTYINGRLISRQLLNDGDDIVIGKARLTFLQPDTGVLKGADDSIEHAAAGSAANTGSQSDSITGDPVDSSAARIETHTDGGIVAEAHDPVDNGNLSLAEKAALNLRPATAVGGVAAVGAAAVAATSDSAVAAKNNVVDSGASEFAGDYYEPDDSEIKAMISDAPVDEDTEFDDSFANPSQIENEKQPAPEPVANEVNTQAAQETENFHGHGHAESVSAEDNQLGYALDGPETHDSTGAVIEIKNGAKSGQVLPIDKPVTTLGRPGIQIAAIMRKPEGYFLMHIESENTADRPRLNDSMIGDDPVMLNSGDSLNVAGIDVQFMLS